MREQYSKYLAQQFSNPAIARQYTTLDEDLSEVFEGLDPLLEDSHEPVKGLIHKYDNRALIKVSYRCAAHCRFCTRIRQIGSSDGDLTSKDDIPNIIAYIRDHTEIEEVILSGGDPLYTPKPTLELLDALELISSIRVIRIGTRLPVVNPISLKAKLVRKVLNKISSIGNKLPFIILIHFEHPDELTSETIAALKMLKETGATLLSQTVFLKGINNDIGLLKRLFENLWWNGVIPYYIYRCDYVRGLEHYVCDLEQEVHIMTELRKQLSGLAYPTYVIDVEGKGKIPVPLGFWNVINRSCLDFDGNTINLTKQGTRSTSFGTLKAVN